MKLIFKKYLPQSYFVGLLILAFLIRIYLFSRRKTDPTELDIYNIIQIIVTLVLGIYLIIRRDSPFVIGLLLRSPIKWIVFLYLFGALSGLWSAIPLFSTYFGIEGLIYIVALAVIIYQQPDAFSLEKFAILSSYLLIFLIILEIIRLGGFTLDFYHWHTNSYSTISAMLFGYCYGEYNNQYRKANNSEKKLLKKGIWISLFFVILGTSAASNIALVSALVVVTLISGKRSFKILSISLLLLLLLLNQFYGDLLFQLLFPGKTVAEVSSMHGRTNLWEYYFDLISQKPWAGWGFAATERISKIYATTTHNSILQIAGGVGIIGLIFFVLYLFKTYYILLTNIRSPFLVGIIGAITAGLVNSNGISFIGAPTSALFLAFIIWNLFGWYYLTGHYQDDAQEDSCQDDIT